MLSARELEEQYLSNTIKTVARGASFADGQEVLLNINEASNTQRMSRWSRIATAQRTSYMVVIVFIIVYLALLLQI
jgi:hypothetical protein